MVRPWCTKNAGGVWAIIVCCNEARETLCQTGIEINDAHIPLHLENPYSVHKVEGNGARTAKIGPNKRGNNPPVFV